MAEATVTMKLKPVEFDRIIKALEYKVHEMQAARNKMGPSKEKTDATGQISETLKLINNLKGVTNGERDH